MNRLFPIASFGAAAGTEKVQTAAIQSAIDACAEAGGGTVVIPPGKFVSGMLRLASHVHLLLEKGAILAASLDYEDFPLQPPVPESRSQKDQGGWSALLFAVRATDLAITGEGVIDGRGKGRPGRLEGVPADCDGRVRNILFIGCTNVRVEGVTMQNAGVWNQHYLDCENVTVSRITVYNHANRNNDGIDVDGCRNFLLCDSVLDTDDDAIVIKSTGPAPCDGITVRNCTVSSFTNAIKCGTESTGGYRNVMISDCRVRPATLRPGDESIIVRTESGISAIALETVDGGVLEHVTVRNVDVRGTRCPVFIRLGKRGRRYAPEAPQPGLGRLTDVLLENVTASGCGNYCSSITGISSRRIGRVELRNVKIRQEGGMPASGARKKCPVYGRDSRPEERFEFIAALAHIDDQEESYPEAFIWGNLPSRGMFIRHADEVLLTDCDFTSDAPDARVPIIASDVNTLVLERVSAAPSGSSVVHLDDVRHYECKK